MNKLNGRWKQKPVNTGEKCIWGELSARVSKEKWKQILYLYVQKGIKKYVLKSWKKSLSQVLLKLVEDIHF